MNLDVKDIIAAYQEQITQLSSELAIAKATIAAMQRPMGDAASVEGEINDPA